MITRIPRNPTPDDDSLEEPEDDRTDDRSRLASPDRVMARIRRICTTNPHTLSIRPIETAAPDSAPLRWKNRTSRATRAAELGTASWMNWIAYSSISTGTNRTGRMDAPIVEKVSATWTTGASSSAASSHVPSACLSSSTRVWRPTSAMAAMSA